MHTVETVSLKKIMASNEMLLNLAREEKWDDFMEMVEKYIIYLHDFIKRQAEIDGEGEKERLRHTLQKLLQNEEEIVQRLQRHLNVLSNKMTLLKQGKKCAQAYSAQNLQSFH